MIPIIKTEKEKELDILLYGEVVTSWMTNNGFKVSAIPRHAHVPGRTRIIYTGGPVPVIISR